MAHFFGRLHGNRGEVTRCGSKSSGITATVESWSTVLLASQYHIDESDHLTLSFQTKHGNPLFHVSFDAEAVARHRNEADVIDAIAKVNEAFLILDSAARDREAVAEAVEVAEAHERGLGV